MAKKKTESTGAGSEEKPKMKIAEASKETPAKKAAPKKGVQSGPPPSDPVVQAPAVPETPAAPAKASSKMRPHVQFGRPPSDPLPAATVAAAAAQAPAAKKGGKGKAAAAKSPAPAAPVGQPMIDTNLAAETAAKLIAAKQAAPANAPAGGEKKESAAFKQLKQSLNKPSIGSNNPLLGGLAGGAGKNKQNFFGGKQGGGGHNQTFGSGSSRFVPRRTSG